MGKVHIRKIETPLFEQREMLAATVKLYNKVIDKNEESLKGLASPKIIKMLEGANDKTASAMLYDMYLLSLRRQYLKNCAEIETRLKVAKSGDKNQSPPLVLEKGLNQTEAPTPTTTAAHLNIANENNTNNITIVHDDNNINNNNNRDNDDNNIIALDKQMNNEQIGNTNHNESEQNVNKKRKITEQSVNKNLEEVNLEIARLETQLTNMICEHEEFVGKSKRMQELLLLSPSCDCESFESETMCANGCFQDPSENRNAKRIEAISSFF